MAPEQLEGKTADARSDIVAFGSVLYEMLTGTKAFEGESQASLMAAILEHGVSYDGRAKDAAARRTLGEKVPGKKRRKAMALGAGFAGRAFLGSSERRGDRAAARQSETPQSARCCARRSRVDRRICDHRMVVD
jgi:serine/threonine protein kinase